MNDIVETFGQMRIKIKEALEKYKPIANNIIKGTEAELITSDYSIKSILDFIYQNITPYLIDEQKEVIKYLEILENMMNSTSDIEAAIDSIFRYTIPNFDFYSIKNEEYLPLDIINNKISDVQIHVCLWKDVLDQNSEKEVYDRGIRNIDGTESLKGTEGEFILKLVNCQEGQEWNLRNRYHTKENVIENPYLERTATVYFSDSKNNFQQNNWKNKTLYLNQESFDSETGELERDYLNTYFSSWSIEGEGEYYLPTQEKVSTIKIYSIGTGENKKLYTKLKIKYNYKGYDSNLHKDVDLFNEINLPDFDLQKYSTEAEIPVYVEVIDERFVN